MLVLVKGNKFKIDSIIANSFIAKFGLLSFNKSEAVLWTIANIVLL